MDKDLLKTSKRQLVICCDGTNNNLTGGSYDTNVVKLVQLFAESDPDPHRIIFYDPGVGNPGELPGATWSEGFKRWLDRVSGLAFGQGVFQNMAECYLFLMKHYQPGDEIYIFGFSRGAFTARSVAGMVNQFGILSPHMESMVSTILHIYFSDREDKTNEDELKKIARQTSLLFTNPECKHVPIKFVGVWDTVAAVGTWPFQQKMTAFPTIVGKKFLNVRQAIALDEHRTQFKPRLYADNNGNDYKSFFEGEQVSIEQLWFRGAHCDVGGGYGKGKTAISNQAMEWIISEAVTCGMSLSVKQVRLDTEANVRETWKKYEPYDATQIVHSEQYTTHLWALTGLSTRQTDVVFELEGVNMPAVVPIEHASVGLSSLSFASGTEWAQRKTKPAIFAWLLVGLIVFLGLGGLLSGDKLAIEPQAIAVYIAKAFELNWLFAKWQLLWMTDGYFNLPSFANPQSSLRSAIIADLAFILAYAHILSWFVVASFAKKAGLRRVNSVVTPSLNTLGLMLPLLISADIAENMFTFLAVTLQLNNENKVVYICGFFMSLASLVKWCALAGVLTLLFPISKSDDKATPAKS